MAPAAIEEETERQGYGRPSGRLSRVRQRAPDTVMKHELGSVLVPLLCGTGNT